MNGVRRIKRSELPNLTISQQSPNNSLLPEKNFLSHTLSLTLSLSHSLTHSLSHSLSLSLTHTLSFTLSLFHKHTLSLSLSLTLSLPIHTFRVIKGKKKKEIIFLVIFISYTTLEYTDCPFRRGVRPPHPAKKERYPECDTKLFLAQSAGAVEYTDCTSAEG